MKRPMQQDPCRIFIWGILEQSLRTDFRLPDVGSHVQGLIAAGCCAKQPQNASGGTGRFDRSFDPTSGYRSS